MPELPEVEIVVRNLNQILSPPVQISSWEFFRKDLRSQIPRLALSKTKGRQINKVSRRAKYILFEFDDTIIISHLGMTGSWRVANQDWNSKSRLKHDHLVVNFSEGTRLVYNDPRRFGFVEVIARSNLQARFKALGVEPLETSVDLNKVFSIFKKLSTQIKLAIMNQKYVVGIGNIYASELLFRARISPLTRCSKIKQIEFEKIWQCCRIVLEESIQKGGSSIENFKNSYGESGQFQDNFFVYGREGEPCRICNTKIKMKTLGGRSTYWCPTCQSSKKNFELSKKSQ